MEEIDLIRCLLEEELPSVHLEVTGHIFRAEGEEPVGWNIYSEWDGESGARTRIVVDAGIVADITVHHHDHKGLVGETQEVAAAILWSAIRAWRLNQQVPHEQPKFVTPEEPASWGP